MRYASIAENTTTRGTSGNGFISPLTDKDAAMGEPTKKRTSRPKSGAQNQTDIRYRSLSRLPEAEKEEIDLPKEPIECWIPGDPVPWARPIPTNRGGLTPERQRTNKQTMQLYLRRAYGNRPAIPMGVPVCVRIEFVYKARSAKEVGVRKATRPDIDNLAKQVLDSLMGKHAPLIITDDGQVVCLTVLKRWGEEPGTKVTVWPDIQN